MDFDRWAGSRGSSSDRLEVCGGRARRQDGGMTYQVTMPGRSFVVSALSPVAAEMCAMQLLAAEAAKDPAVAEASKSLSVTVLA
jgi:hypothetical protein